MSENNRAILEMLEQGKISEEEAARLLDALDAKEAAGEEAPASQAEAPEEKKPDSITVSPGEGMKTVLDGQGGAEAIGAGGAETLPVPPVPPVPPTPPEAPAMPAMPAAPAPPLSGDPEALERYNEEAERFQETCQELLERHQERLEAYYQRLEEGQERYQEQMDRYQEQMERYQERVEAYQARNEEQRERHQAQLEEYQLRMERQGSAQAGPDSGYWSLTDEEYGRAYGQAYEKVYNAGYPEVEELGLNTPEGQSRLSELCGEAAQAAEEAVRQAQAEKQGGQPGGDWQERTRRWGARIGDISAEICRAMQGLGAQISDEIQDALEEVQDAMGDVQDSLGEFAEAWQDWAEEEDEDEEDWDEEDWEEDEDEEEDGRVPQPAQGEQTADGWYVNTSQCPLSALEKLDVNWLSGSVEAVPWDGGYVEVSERSRKPLNQDQKMRVYVLDARELTIHFTAQQHNFSGAFGRGWNIFFPEKHLTVKIPRELCGQVGNLKIHCVSAGVRVSELSGEDFKIDTVSGEVNASALHAEHMKLNSVSGRVYAVGSSAEKIQLSSVSGVVEASGLAAEKAKFSSVSGKVLAHANAESFEVSTTSGKAELQVDQCPEKARLTSVSGSVSIILPENDGFTVGYNAVSGRLNSEFPLTGNLGKKKGKGVYGNGATSLTMHTTSGRMNIQKAK